MKLLRRLALVMLVAVLMLAATGLYIRHRMHSTPIWYRQWLLDDETQHRAANSMNEKLIRSYSAAQDAQAAMVRASHASTGPTTEPSADPITIELSEAEINAFFRDWDKVEHWRQRLSEYFQNPVVILQDHELILAADIPDYSSVVSLHSSPRLEGGKLCVGPLSAMAGTIPLPMTMVAKRWVRMESSIKKKVPEFRQDAEIGPHGWANLSAVEAAMGELVLDILENRPAEPVIMLREPGRTGTDARSIPVKITAIEVSDGMLRVTFRLMTVDEREAFLQQLKGTGAEMRGVPG